METASACRGREAHSRSEKKRAGEHTLYIYSICMYTCMDECARVYQTLSVRPGAREARMRART